MLDTPFNKLKVSIDVPVPRIFPVIPRLQPTYRPAFFPPAYLNMYYICRLAHIAAYFHSRTYACLHKIRLVVKVERTSEVGTVFLHGSPLEGKRLIQFTSPEHQELLQFPWILDPLLRIVCWYSIHGSSLEDKRLGPYIWILSGGPEAGAAYIPGSSQEGQRLV